MDRSSPAPTARLRATFLTAFMFATALVLFAPDASASQQLSDDDELRLAAFRHLIGTLLPIDSTASRNNCVEVTEGVEFDAPPNGPGADPSPPLLTRLVRLGPRVLARSECEVSSPVVSSSNPAVIVERPVVYGVGRPSRSAGRTRIPIAYYVHGMNGGGWLCTAVRSGRSWRIADCLPTWIS